MMLAALAKRLRNASEVANKIFLSWSFAVIIGIVLSYQVESVVEPP